MSDNLIANIKKTATLKLEEEDFIRSKFKIRTLRKRELLLQRGEVCKFLSYVETGNLRVFNLDQNMLEKNVYFATADWWVIDLESFIRGSEARFNIQALTDCTLLSIHKSTFDELLEAIPKLEKWFRVLLQNALISSENRIYYEISLTAEERYQKFREKYPYLEKEISQRNVASYLGITPEHLSKVKSRDQDPKTLI